MISRLTRRLRRINDDDSSETNEENNIIRNRVEVKLHARRPPNTAFRQQRLKSWQPIMTSRAVLILLLITIIIFVPLGVAFILGAYNVQLVEINYSSCDSLASNDELQEIPSKYVKSHFKSSDEQFQWKYNDGVCQIQMVIPNDIKGTVYQYYKLTNFYQNHRKYVDSYDWYQLKGEAVPLDSLSGNCSPLKENGGKTIYPCGLVANSMFNDTLGGLNGVGGTDQSYTFSEEGIAWSSDLNLYGESQYNAEDVVPPPNWANKYPQGYTNDTLKAIGKDERFMNWMKTAALPSFLKLYGIKEGGILKGNYTMDITMNYPVLGFGGSKSLVLSTSNIFGGRHLGLGVAYLIVGILSFLFLIFFLLKLVLYRR